MTAQPVRVLLLEQIHPDAEDLLRAAGFEVETEARALDEDELVARICRRQPARHPLQDACHRSEVIDAAPGLTRRRGVLHRHQSDRSATARHERGIAVFNAPFSNTRSGWSNWRSPRLSRCAGG